MKYKSNSVIGVTLFMIVFGDNLAKNCKENLEIQIPSHYNFSTDLLFHGYNVGTVSCEIGEKIKLKNYKDMILMGMMHDIGKCKIPSEILFKPTKLNSSEFTQMKGHVLYSEQLVLLIMGNNETSSYYAKVIRHHHENWNGSGYPDGLRYNNIPIESRILSIADVFDAMMHPRIYRPYPVTNPIEVMEKEVEKKFDPELFKVAKPILRKWHLQRLNNR